MENIKNKYDEAINNNNELIKKKQRIRKRNK